MGKKFWICYGISLIPGGDWGSVYWEMAGRDFAPRGCFPKGLREDL